MNRIKSIIQKILLIFFPRLSWLIKFRNANRKSLVTAKFPEKIWAYRNGFYLETVKICNINRNNFNHYLTDRYYETLFPINKTYSRIIDNKLYLPFLLKDYPENVPVHYYFTDKGRLINLNPLNIEFADIGLMELIKKKKKLVLKHCYLDLGRGFNVTEWDGENFLLNKSIISFEEINLFVKSLDNYIITEFVYQHKYAYEIHPSSTNTVRLFCIWDDEKNKFFIPRAAHRFGLNGGMVDNLGDGGGISVFVDVLTGKLKSTGLIKEKGEPINFFNCSIHPNSKMPVAGVQVPNWEDTIQKTLCIMNNLSFLKYVAIDLVITDNGFKIIEINSFPRLFHLQVEEGALLDERFVRFFSAKNRKTNFNN